MELSIKGKQVDVGDALRHHIEEKLPEAVAKYFQSPLSAQVMLSKQGHGFCVDIKVHIGKKIFAQAEGVGDPYGAFEEALEHVTKRLRRYHRRLGDHHKKTVVSTPALESVFEVDSPKNEPMIIAEHQTEIETLSVEEAVMRMDLAGSAVLMFRNERDGALNIVYRRRDSHVGWVAPKASH